LAKTQTPKNGMVAEWRRPVLFLSLFVRKKKPAPKNGLHGQLLVWRLPFCRHPKTRDLANSNVVVVVGAAAAAAVARIDGGSGL
jgi:hypothetical protein